MTQLMQGVANQVVERLFGNDFGFIQCGEQDLGTHAEWTAAMNDSRSLAAPQDFQLVKAIAARIEDTLQCRGNATLNIDA